MGDLILAGLGHALAPVNVLTMIVGVVIGMAFGAMPGLSGATAMTMLLPLIVLAPPDTGILLLLAIWNAAVYAGSISAICLNIPGTAAAAATTIEGYQLARRGLARRALRASIVGSTLGGFASAAALLFLSPPLAQLALDFGPAEMFAFALFGMAAVTSLTSGSVVRGAIATLFGLFLATIGIAPSGEPRLVAVPELITGVPIIPTLIGLFTVPVVLEMIRENRGRVAIDLSSLDAPDNFLTRLSDWAKHAFNIVRSALIGVIVGVLPGAGPTIAAFIAYGEARRSAPVPNEYGRGDVAGVLAPETANNAAVFSSLVPAFTLGIPGSVDAVIIMAALTMHGLVPGPLLIERSGEVVYTLFMGAFAANAIMLVVGLVGAKHVANITRVRTTLLAPAILVLSFLGAYSVHNNIFDVILALGIGTLAYGLRLLGVPLAPVILGAILGNILETHLVQALVLYDGAVGALVARPLATVMIVLAIGSIAYSLAKEFRSRRRPEALGEEA